MHMLSFVSEYTCVFRRTSFPLSTEAAMGKSNCTQIYQLWASVSSALCGCVNNPQNGTVVL